MKKYNFVEPYSCIVDDSNKVLTKFFQEEPKTEEELLNIKTSEEMYVIGSIKYYGDFFVINPRTFSPTPEIGGTLVVVNCSKNNVEAIGAQFRGIKSIDDHFEI